MSERQWYFTQSLIDPALTRAVARLRAEHGPIGLNLPERAPVRIQRQRTRGWRMPADAVYVGRPTKWGNPFGAGMNQELRFSGVKIRPEEDANPDGLWAWRTMPISLATAIALYRDALQDLTDDPMYTAQPLDVTVDDARRELAGRDLACWCPLDQPCHADVLLEVANR